MYFARFPLLAVVAASLVIGSGARAVPVTYGTYFDETASPPGICSASLCTVFFSQVPTNKLLLVTHVACYFITPFPVTNLILGVNTFPTSGPLQRQYPLQLPQPVLHAGTYYTQISHPVNFLVGQGRYPFVQAQTGGGGGNWGIQCTYSGTLVNPIP